MCRWLNNVCTESVGKECACLKISGVFSLHFKFLSPVPQRSTSGQLLFNVFTNGTCSSILNKSFEILSFANDIESSLLLSNSMTVFGYKKKLISYRVGVLLIVWL